MLNHHHSNTPLNHAQPPSHSAIYFHCPQKYKFKKKLIAVQAPKMRKIRHLAY